MVIIFFGLPGSGKSYLAQRVARTLGADYLSSDVLRKRLITKPTYSYEEKLIVYKKMYDTMYEHKKSSNSLVLDGTFFKRSIRDSFKKLAEDLNMEIKWIEVVSDEEVLKERLSKKRVDS
ncbi:MAG: ATP-binding protein, partial [Bacteroidota bacterium]